MSVLQHINIAALYVGCVCVRVCVKISVNVLPTVMSQTHPYSLAGFTFLSDEPLSLTHT